MAFHRGHSPRLNDNRIINQARRRPSKDPVIERDRAWGRITDSYIENQRNLASHFDDYESCHGQSRSSGRSRIRQRQEWPWLHGRVIQAYVNLLEAARKGRRRGKGTTSNNSEKECPEGRRRRWTWWTEGAQGRQGPGKEVYHQIWRRRLGRYCSRRWVVHPISRILTANWWVLLGQTKRRVNWLRGTYKHGSRSRHEGQYSQEEANHLRNTHSRG